VGLSSAPRTLSFKRCAGTVYQPESPFVERDAIQKHAAPATYSVKNVESHHTIKALGDLYNNHNATGRLLTACVSRGLVEKVVGVRDRCVPWF
jgi:hypothetical protein